MSSDVENDYFCDGITEEIINALAKIKSLKVTSRTSSFFFKNKEVSVKDIAEKLKVAALLEGSVRRSGNIIRITAQLIQTEDDFHFWSETWDRELNNIFEIQDEISLLIADKIRENFGHFDIQDHLVLKQTDNINAYEYSLMAKFHKDKWNPDDSNIAKDFYNKALALDPNHVPSLVGLSDVYSFLAMTGAMPFEEAWAKTMELVNKALSIDEQNPQAYYQLANSAFFTECNFSKSLDYALKSVKFKPNYVEAQQFLSFLYILSGDEKRAREHLNYALDIDPLSQETQFFSAYMDYMTGDYVNALNQLNECLKVNAKNLPAHSVKCQCLIMLEMYEDAIHYFDDLDANIVEGEKTGTLALAYALKKDQKNAEKYFRLLEKQAKDPNGFTSDSFLFMFYAVLGDLDKAFEWIISGIETKASLLLLRYADPLVNSLKTDARYQQYHRKLFPVLNDEIQTMPKKPLMDNTTVVAYSNLLLSHLDTNEPYLDPSLTLRELANQIDIHPNQLSWLLNEHQGKNFNEFINAYRVEKFKRIAKAPENANLTLIGLAYDCGFNSKTVFNTYFKKETGLTPKQYLRGK